MPSKILPEELKILSDVFGEDVVKVTLQIAGDHRELFFWEMFTLTGQNPQFTLIQAWR